MKTKQCLLVTVVGVSLFAALMNLPSVLGAVRQLIVLVLSIIPLMAVAVELVIEDAGRRLQIRKNPQLN